MKMKDYVSMVKINTDNKTSDEIYDEAMNILNEFV